MKRLLAAPILVLLAMLALAGGVVVAVATSHDDEADPAPPAATRDVAGVVSVGRPIAPYRAGEPPTGQIELRVRDPEGGAPHAVLFHRHEDVRRGRTVRYRCFEVGPERAIRRYPVGDGGTCSPVGTGAASPPWSISITESIAGPMMLHGSADARVKRLTVAGPGGTFIVPRSRSGAFAVAYGGRARGRAVLTATLADGSKRFFRSRIPSSRRPDGAAVAADPGGLPAWFTSAAERTEGARRGQTCLQVAQELNLREPTPGRRGGSVLAPSCGDLSRHPVFARTVRLAPSSQPATFGPGRFAARRTIVAGAAAQSVRGVAIVSPAGRHELPIAPAGRAFLAVLPATTRPADLTLEVTTADGRVQRFADPVAVNRATTANPPPRLRGGVRLRLDGARRVVLSARLTGPVSKRLEITFRGREVRMRRAGGPAGAPLYTGVYDGDRGSRRPIVAGRLYRLSVQLCGDSCSTLSRRSRLR
ncbi:MAG: hypothetical protein Q8O56_05795 [Solirubrobacteraceae bacterium]|nr:hypothetical protein [Solirubrobacteraceae bacterium]